MKPGADDLVLLHLGEDLADAAGAVRQRRIRRRFDVPVCRLVSLLAETRHVLTIDRRGACDLLSLLDHRFQTRVVCIVRRCRAAFSIYPYGDIRRTTDPGTAGENIIRRKTE